MKRLNVLKVMFLVTVAALFYVLKPDVTPEAADTAPVPASLVAPQPEAADTP